MTNNKIINRSLNKKIFKKKKIKLTNNKIKKIMDKIIKFHSKK